MNIDWVTNQKSRQQRIRFAEFSYQRSRSQWFTWDSPHGDAYKIKGFSDSWRRMLETKYVGVNFEMLVTESVVVVTEIRGTNINKLSTWYLFCHQHRKIVTSINVAELTNDSTDNLKIINLWVWSLGLKYFLSLYTKIV